MFDVDCNKSYNAEDNVNNDKFEKETGRYWSGDESSDVSTYHSDDNENVLVGNETGPIFVKVHPFFGRLLEKCVKINALMIKASLAL